MSDVNSLRTYREQYGLSQEELGEQVGVTRQTIATWERGDRQPSLIQLSKVAKVFGVPPDLLLQPEVQKITPITTGSLSLLFRADDPLALTSIVREHLTRKAVDFSQIEKMVGEVPVLPVSRPIEEYEETVVEDLAKEVRNWLGVGEFAPIGDVLALLEAKSLKIIEYSLENQISGFSAYTDDWGGVIFINTSHPTERKFFTALHELAHLILHRREYRQPQGRSRPTDPREKAANHLAGAVLLPLGAVQRELHAYKNRWLPEPLLQDIKRRYGVSLRTTLYRAEQAGLITKQQKGQQIGILNKKYGAEEELPKLPSPQRLTRLKRLVYTALVKEEITASRAAEILEENLRIVQKDLLEWLHQDGEELN
ncbi:ImmA/IrrE family metallo-endopeptidase [Leptolyngbya sp. AN03gr2]|uniref:ImmA/IrrE family metallo-endopeptidase n=1 Tax=unclassified Leptolyngbya TaxID=2650499 RepID=UPI003D314D7C